MTLLAIKVRTEVFDSLFTSMCHLIIVGHMSKLSRSEWVRLILNAPCTVTFEGYRTFPGTMKTNPCFR